jgi:hypothetical protein
VEWSNKFDHIPTSMFAFASLDFSLFVIASKNEILREYDNENLSYIRSSAFPDNAHISSRHSYHNLNDNS